MTSWHFDLSELTVFTINHCILPEAVARRYSVKKVFLEILQNSWETPLSESLFDKISGRPKNTSFTEHLHQLFLYFSRFHGRIKLVQIMKLMPFIPYFISQPICPQTFIKCFRFKVRISPSKEFLFYLLH